MADAEEGGAAWLDARLNAAIADSGRGQWFDTAPERPLDAKIAEETDFIGDGDEVIADGDGDVVDLDAEDTFFNAPAGCGSSNGAGQFSDRSDNIRVFVRARPANARERTSAPYSEIVRVDAGTGAVHLLAEPPRSFAFDGVLAETSTQEEVFALVGAGVGEACLSGYNGSIYVYGQTGSGKTHTMQGPVASVQAMHSDERRGLMCRILALIFQEVARRHQEVGSVQYTCKCSYLEIYKEQITDLLEASSTNLQVREDVNRGVYVERLSEHSVWNFSDAVHVLWKGLHQRHVGATQMNELSSRSHAVFTLALEATSTTTGGVTSTRGARLSLIDLAGSERQSFDPHSTTMHESLRVKEAGAINRSLSALTNVIMSLSHMGQRRRLSGAPGAPGTGGARRPFVRYRDSKLTFLLRDSLGGNSKTVIVACVSPSALCFGETLSTLKFAARAKHIRCAAVKNEEYSGTVESLQLEVKSLKQQLELLSTRGLIPGAEGLASREASLAELAGAASAGQDGARPGGSDQQGSGGATAGNTGVVGEQPDGGQAGSSDQADLLASCGLDDELRRLYGPRRVMRLEILLGAALGRERRCELKRHKLDKFTQYLNGLLERKEQYFDALRDYFAYLVAQATEEGCYMPEVTTRLMMFRRELSSVSTDSRKIADDFFKDGPITSRSGVVDSSVAEDSPDRPMVSASEGHLGAVGMQDEAIGSRSCSSGLLASGETPGRRSRRGTSQAMQLRSPLGRMLRSSGLGSPTASSATLTPSSGQAWFPEESSGFADEDLMMLRAENKLLRRQLESHPELFRLAAENRLLREHLASLVQQKSSLPREEPPQPKGHKHQRQAAGTDQLGQPKKDVTLRRERSLTRTSRSSILPNDLDQMSPTRTNFQIGDVGQNANKGKRAKFSPFPGIEDATQITPSSSSAESETDEASPQRPTRANTTAGSADATSFLPTMSREVEGLLRMKGELEDALQQLLKAKAAEAAQQDAQADAQGKAKVGSREDRPTTPRKERAMSANEIEARVSKEILQGTADALRFTDAMLAKGKGDTLLLSAGGACQDDEFEEDDGTAFGIRNRGIEGLDERDVFMSLMRSLPSEGPPVMTRHGYASSAPHLFRRNSRQQSSMRFSSGHIGDPSTLRTSSSMGSAGTRLLRNRSTMQLHRIAEQAITPLEQTPELGEGGAYGDGSPPPIGYAEPGEMLQEAAQKSRQLCHQLELIGDKYRDMRAQIKPLQEEYYRRLDECRFLEAQCRRLDVHYRLLNERASSLDPSVLANRPKLKHAPLGQFNSSMRQGHAHSNVGPARLGSMWKSMSESSTNLFADAPAVSGGAVPAGASGSTLKSSPSSAFVGGSASISAGPATGSFANLGRKSVSPGVAVSARSEAPPSWGTSVGVAPYSQPRASSLTAISMGQSASATAVRGRAEVPPRGLLYAATVQELRHAELPKAGACGGNVGRMISGHAPWRSTEEDMRRVFSAPQLPVARLHFEHSAFGIGGASSSAHQPRAAGSGAPPQHTGSIGANDSAAGDATAKFLASARQSPNSRAAALQYLMTSAGQTLGTGPAGGSSNAAEADWSGTSRSPNVGSTPALGYPNTGSAPTLGGGGGAASANSAPGRSFPWWPRS